jgi:hypothetical protein
MGFPDDQEIAIVGEIVMQYIFPGRLSNGHDFQTQAMTKFLEFIIWSISTCLSLTR